MSRSNSTYSLIAADIDTSKLGSDQVEKKGLVLDIFEAWKRTYSPIDSSSNALHTNAYVMNRSEGASGVQVLEVGIMRNEGQAILVKFIIRFHKEVLNAEEEKQVVAIFKALHLDYISCTILEDEKLPKNCVIYYHAGAELGVGVVDLWTIIRELLQNTESIERVSRFAKNLDIFRTSISNALSNLYHQGVATSASNIYDQIRFRFPPDFIIDLRALHCAVSNKTVTAVEDLSLSPNADKIQSINFENLVPSIVAENMHGPKYLSVFLGEELKRSKSQIVSFKCGGNHVWVIFPEKVLTSEEIFDKILMPQSSNYFYSSRKALGRLGFEDEAIISGEDYKRIFQNHGEIIRSRLFSDLHSGNILIGENESIKIIDLIDFDDELAGTDFIRLSVSLWLKLSQEAEISDSDIDSLLTSIYEGREINNESGKYLEKIILLMRAINPEIPKQKAALTWVTQILLFQKLLLREPKRSNMHIFSRLSKYWISQFRDETVSQKLTEILPQNNRTNEGSNSVGTFFSLWESALYDARIQSYGFTTIKLLKDLKEALGLKANFPLTELQRRLIELNKNEDSMTSSVFNSTRHVVLAAPTSTGKSTIAELFLIRPSFLNSTRRCAVYIAPTKALTRAKYLELKTLFPIGTQLHNQIILSTGEDNEHDWRISHGKFSIACIVYEKANILFSESQKLLDVVGTVVVDEMHMLNDLERGPILELALTKILHLRNSIDFAESRAPSKEIVRIIAISTENIPDQSLEKYLSIYESNGTEQIGPIVIHSTVRPVKVNHILVLPKVGNIEIPIVSFESSEKRKLSAGELARIESEVSEKLANVNEREKNRYSSADRKQSLAKFVIEKLSAHSASYRMLVFVPGKREVEELGAFIRNLRKKENGNRQPKGFEALVDRLNGAINKIDDDRVKKRILENCQQGVFCHHADLDQRVRSEIEAIFGEKGTSYPPMILFATETLSYGINLAVNDVVLLGYKFYTQNRRRELTKVPLSLHAFHNMAGRAGRLGKLDEGQNAKVFFFLLEEENVLEFLQYYSKIDPTSSRLYVSEDKEKQIRKPSGILRKLSYNRASTFGNNDSGRSEISPSDFSFPFVRSILEALRHLNYTDDRGRPKDDIRKVSLESLLEFFEMTFFVIQTNNRKESSIAEAELKLFIEAAEIILRGCTNPNLALVEIHQGETDFFLISERGRAIIDTGTEITTIKPLLIVISHLQPLWSKYAKGASFPAEFYLLCFLTVPEVFRKFFNNTPEGRSKTGNTEWNESAANSNRAKVKQILDSSVSLIMTRIKIEVDSNFSADLVKMLESLEFLQEVKGNYQQAAVDSVLRIFASLIQFINFERVTKIEGIWIGEELLEGNRGQFQGFSQLREELRWKLLFVVTLLNTSMEFEFSLETERAIYLLKDRLRYGCTESAIPLFYPRSSDISRKEAKSFIQNEVLPRELVTNYGNYGESLSRVEIEGNKVVKLRTDITLYAKSQLEELVAILLSTPADAETDRGRVQLAVGEFLNLFDLATKAALNSDFDLPSIVEFISAKFNGIDFTIGNEAINADRDLFDEFDKIPRDETSNIISRAEEGQVGISWNFENQASRLSDLGGGSRIVRITGVEFGQMGYYQRPKSSWGTLGQFLSDYTTVPNLVVVYLPWISGLGNMKMKEEIEFHRPTSSGFKTTIISATAFITISYLLSRNFFSGKIIWEMFSDSPMNFYRLEDVHLILRSRKIKLLPMIESAVIKFFEL